MSAIPPRGGRHIEEKVATDLILAIRELDDAAAELGSVTDDLRDALVRDTARGGVPELARLPSLCAKVTELAVKVRTLRASLYDR
jgi:hypothetical protein